LVGVESHLVTSNLNLWLVVSDVMSYFLIWSQRFRLAINCILCTTTFKKDCSETCHKMTVFPSERLSTITLPYCDTISFTHFLLKSVNSVYESLKQTTGVWATTKSTQRRCWYDILLSLFSFWSHYSHTLLQIHS